MLTVATPNNLGRSMQRWKLSPDLAVTLETSKNGKPGYSMSGESHRRARLSRARATSVPSANKLSSPGVAVSSAAKPALRVAISTGDVSGDMHAARVVTALFERAEELGVRLEVVALAGERTAAAGATLIGDNTGLSSIGLLEAVPFVIPSLKLQARVREALKLETPDVAVMIDYPGVNIPFGKYLREEQRTRIVYYIPPNEWLWNESRTPTICGMCDAILCNYQGEVDYFKQNGGRAELVGHPLLDSVQGAPSRLEARKILSIDPAATVVLLTPASRAQARSCHRLHPFSSIKPAWSLSLLHRGSAAIFSGDWRHRDGQDDAQATGVIAMGKMTPRRLAALCFAKDARLAGDLRVIPEVRLQFVVSLAAPHLREAMQLAVEESGLEAVILWEGDPHVAMAAADAALTKSGSVNVELALLGVPQVVLYRIDALTGWLARNVLKFQVEHVSLVNLILDRAAVPEFIQEQCISEDIAVAVEALLPNAGALRKRADMLLAYEELREALGKTGVASRAAACILDIALRTKDGPANSV
ncbi:hypothetical protein CYMTET_56398 [Cymbomonas tetramitiformis]|uniref:lipid-A-disaccharide synthase n=1 Tax=Cymbomonas tetramitiformis TaxID=36881 RepID=A0AAE0BCR5_9CHLO|nr:hypothetical protein CYMTET_56398 [Cymbomonas tetramitiformis]